MKKMRRGVGSPVDRLADLQADVLPAGAGTRPAGLDVQTVLTAQPVAVATAVAAVAVDLQAAAPENTSSS